MRRVGTEIEGERMVRRLIRLTCAACLTLAACATGSLASAHTSAKASEARRMAASRARRAFAPGPPEGRRMCETVSPAGMAGAVLAGAVALVRSASGQPATRREPETGLARQGVHTDGITANGNDIALVT